jgi:hypothetical protein
MTILISERQLCKAQLVDYFHFFSLTWSCHSLILASLYDIIMNVLKSFHKIRTFFNKCQKNVDQDFLNKKIRKKINK